jgi:thiamine phosphate synthase YjbQ (UPF0047 family)
MVKKSITTLRRAEWRLGTRQGLRLCEFDGLRTRESRLMPVKEAT